MWSWKKTVVYPHGFVSLLFLIYRVELKDSSPSNIYHKKYRRNVPNLPCGVESLHKLEHTQIAWQTVPNLPCGVERQILQLLTQQLKEFLIYRVELKVQVERRKFLALPPVPNLPCGVERPGALCLMWVVVCVFLIYRVELKANSGSSTKIMFCLRS